MVALTIWSSCVGVNVFPSSIAAVVQRFPMIAEYRVIVQRRGQLDDLKLELEADDETARQVAQQLDIAIGLRVDTHVVPSRFSARSDGKARRWVDLRFHQIGMLSHGQPFKIPWKAWMPLQTREVSNALPWLSMPCTVAAQSG